VIETLPSSGGDEAQEISLANCEALPSTERELFTQVGFDAVSDFCDGQSTYVVGVGAGDGTIFIGVPPKSIMKMSRGRAENPALAEHCGLTLRMMEFLWERIVVMNQGMPESSSRILKIEIAEMRNARVVDLLSPALKKSKRAKMDTEEDLAPALRVKDISRGLVEIGKVTNRECEDEKQMVDALLYAAQRCRGGTFVVIVHMVYTSIRAGKTVVEKNSLTIVDLTFTTTIGTTNPQLLDDANPIVKKRMSAAERAMSAMEVVSQSLCKIAVKVKAGAQGKKKNFVQYSNDDITHLLRPALKAVDVLGGKSGAPMVGDPADATLRFVYFVKVPATMGENALVGDGSARDIVTPTTDLRTLQIMERLLTGCKEYSDAAAQLELQLTAPARAMDKGRPASPALAEQQARAALASRAVNEKRLRESRRTEHLSQVIRREASGLRAWEKRQEQKREQDECAQMAMADAETEGLRAHKDTIELDRYRRNLNKMVGFWEEPFCVQSKGGQEAAATRARGGTKLPGPEKFAKPLHVERFESAGMSKQLPSCTARQFFGLDIYQARCVTKDLGAPTFKHLVGVYKATRERENVGSLLRKKASASRRAREERQRTKQAFDDMSEKDKQRYLRKEKNEDAKNKRRKNRGDRTDASATDEDTVVRLEDEAIAADEEYALIGRLDPTAYSTSAFESALRSALGEKGTAGSVADSTTQRLVPMLHYLTHPRSLQFRAELAEGAEVAMRRQMYGEAAAAAIAEKYRLQAIADEDAAIAEAERQARLAHQLQLQRSFAGECKAVLRALRGKASANMQADFFAPPVSPSSRPATSTGANSPMKLLRPNTHITPLRTERTDEVAIDRRVEEQKQQQEVRRQLKVMEVQTGEEQQLQQREQREQREQQEQQEQREQREQQSALPPPAPFQPSTQAPVPTPPEGVNVVVVPSVTMDLNVEAVTINFTIAVGGARSPSPTPAKPVSPAACMPISSPTSANVSATSQDHEALPALEEPASEDSLLSMSQLAEQVEMGKRASVPGTPASSPLPSPEPARVLNSDADKDMDDDDCDDGFDDPEFADWKKLGSSLLVMRRYLDSCQELEVPPRRQMCHQLGLPKANFSAVGLSGAAALAFCPLLAAPEVRLHTVDLSDNMLGEAGGKAIGQALRFNCSITCLDLSSNALGAHGAQFIFDAFDGDKGQEEGKATIALGTKDDYDSDIADDDEGYMDGIPGYDKIKPAEEVYDGGLKNVTLRALMMQHNELDHHTCFDGCGRSVSLTELDVAYNTLGDVGATNLATGVLVGRSGPAPLQILRLGWNGVGPVGARALAEGMLRDAERSPEATVLLRAHLGNLATAEQDERDRLAAEIDARIAAEEAEKNGTPLPPPPVEKKKKKKKGHHAHHGQHKKHVPPPGWQVDLLPPPNPTMTEVCLAANGMGSEGGGAIARALMVHRHIRLLDCRFTHLCSAGAMSLAESLRLHPSIRTVNLHGNVSLGPSGFAAMHAAMRDNPRLYVAGLHTCVFSAHAPTNLPASSDAENRPLSLALTESLYRRAESLPPAIAEAKAQQPSEDPQLAKEQLAAHIQDRVATSNTEAYQVARAGEIPEPIARLLTKMENQFKGTGTGTCAADADDDCVGRRLLQVYDVLTPKQEFTLRLDVFADYVLADMLRLRAAATGGLWRCSNAKVTPKRTGADTPDYGDLKQAYVMMTPRCWLNIVCAPVPKKPPNKKKKRGGRNEAPLPMSIALPRSGTMQFDMEPSLWDERQLKDHPMLLTTFLPAQVDKKADSGVTTDGGAALAPLQPVSQRKSSELNVPAIGGSEDPSNRRQSRLQNDRRSSSNRQTNGEKVIVESSVRGRGTQQAPGDEDDDEELDGSHPQFLKLPSNRNQTTFEFQKIQMQPVRQEGLEKVQQQRLEMQLQGLPATAPAPCVPAIQIGGVAGDGPTSSRSVSKSPRRMQPLGMHPSTLAAELAAAGAIAASLFEAPPRGARATARTATFFLRRAVSTAVGASAVSGAPAQQHWRGAHSQPLGQPSQSTQQELETSRPSTSEFREPTHAMPATQPRRTEPENWVKHAVLSPTRRANSPTVKLPLPTPAFGIVEDLDEADLDDDVDVITAKVRAEACAAAATAADNKLHDSLLNDMLHRNSGLDPETVAAVVLVADAVIQASEMKHQHMEANRKRSGIADNDDHAAFCPRPSPPALGMWKLLQKERTEEMLVKLDTDELRLKKNLADAIKISDKETRRELRDNKKEDRELKGDKLDKDARRRLESTRESTQRQLAARRLKRIVTVQERERAIERSRNYGRWRARQRRIHALQLWVGEAFTWSAEAVMGNHLFGVAMGHAEADRALLAKEASEAAEEEARAQRAVKQAADDVMMGARQEFMKKSMADAERAASGKKPRVPSEKQLKELKRKEAKAAKKAQADAEKQAVLDEAAAVLAATAAAEAAAIAKAATGPWLTKLLKEATTAAAKCVRAKLENSVVYTGIVPSTMPGGVGAVIKTALEGMGVDVSALKAAAVGLQRQRLLKLMSPDARLQATTSDWRDSALSTSGWHAGGTDMNDEAHRVAAEAADIASGMVTVVCFNLVPD
jgi:hypothetical protein